MERSKIKLKKHRVQHEIDMFDGNFSMGSANPKCSLGPPIDWTSHNKVILPPGWLTRGYEQRNRIGGDPTPAKHVGHWGHRKPLQKWCQETHIEKNLARRSLNSPHLQGAAPESGRI